VTERTGRIGPGTRREVGVLNWAIAQLSGLVTGTAPPALFLTLGRHRKLFRGWLRFAGRLMPRGTLPRRETELAILRVAHVRGCAYEFEHHARLGRRAGVRDADVARVREGPAAAGWPVRDRAMLAAVDQLLAERDLDEPTWTALRAHLDERATIELIMLVGHYDMLATAIAALRIAPDPPGLTWRRSARRRPPTGGPGR
jgi:AhpD family alkylhydroperoxidase